MATPEAATIRLVGSGEEVDLLLLGLRLMKMTWDIGLPLYLEVMLCSDASSIIKC